MRSYVVAHGAPIAAVVLATGVALSGCADDEGAERTAPVSAAASSGAAEPSTTGEPEAEPEDTWGDVTDPATVPLDAELLRGVEAVSIWEGATPQVEEGLGGGELVLGPGRSLALLVSTLPEVLAPGSSQAMLRDWSRVNGVTSSKVQELEPVVVDGQEMLRARGDNGFTVYDAFFLGDDQIGIEVVVATPIDFTDAEREEAIGQVMVTLEFE